MRRRANGIGLILLALLGAGISRAGEVVDAQLRREADWLVVDLQLAELLDERTRSTVESGLPGSCLLEIELLDDRGELQASRRLERSLEVDLWDDLVRLIDPSQVIVYASIAEADSAWSRWSSLRLVRWSSLAGGRDYHLEIAVHVQPLGAEERERVSEWVSASGTGDRRDVSIDMGGLVRRFFGSGDETGDVEIWRGPRFRIESVEVRP